MKNIIVNLSFACFILFSFPSLAQQGNKDPATLGMDFLLNDYGSKHALNDKNYGSVNKMIPGVAVNYSNGLSDRLNYTVMIAGSFPDSAGNNTASAEKHFLFETSFDVKRKFLSNRSRFQPFALAGIGCAIYRNDIGIIVPAGIGLQTRITKDILSTLNAQYRFALGSSMPGHFFYSIGIAGAIIRKSAKSKTKKDIHSHESNGSYIIVSVDRDHDGIKDSEDKCPDQPGIASLGGCPLRNETDTIIKSVAAESSALSTPDTKTESSVDTNRVHDKLNLLANQILFETGSHHLKTVSFGALDAVTVIMEENPGMLLQIEGHTDNMGSSESNLILSQKRALSVLHYLIKKGISQKRLTSSGFGETRPRADNNANAGRAVNRRVELIIKQ